MFLKGPNWVIPLRVNGYHDVERAEGGGDGYVTQGGPAAAEPGAPHQHAFQVAVGTLDRADLLRHHVLTVLVEDGILERWSKMLI